MGFETIIAAIISITLIIAVTGMFISNNYFLAELSTMEYKKDIHRSIEIINTKISIIKIVYNNTLKEVVADVKNNGEVRFSNLSYFDVFIYGNASGYIETYYPTIIGVDMRLVEEITNPGIFDPHETMRAEVLLDNNLPNGTYVLVICTPNGVCNSKEFYVG